MRTESGGYRRDHLRALAQPVEVDAKEVRIMGSKSELLRTLVAASSTKTAGFGSARFCTEVARSKGFEPLTPRFEVWCSIQLSYERVRGTIAASAQMSRRRARMEILPFERALRQRGSGLGSMNWPRIGHACWSEMQKHGRSALHRTKARFLELFLRRLLL